MTDQQQNPQHLSYPNPSLSPDKVIEIQLDALQHNELPTEDSGIEICFRFASPSNKINTGPLTRFIKMIKNPFYECLINFTKARFQPASNDGAAWKITILKNGIDHVFLWQLSKQVSGEYVDCWMTDSVIKVQ
eukprot:TRINITY_DN1819_c0_g2_i2.p1 TRINITY_DN1819_c0_g2~~TRINITY_DN1819_c0_g2_i2.p1  ORF type:complete len:133 (-),score=14.89 TRINITY_DN1819_c0_g2_i2:25-423(-)